MIHHLELAGQGIALATSGTVTRQGPGALSIQADHLSLLHDMRHGEVYRTGQNSWSPSGWRHLAESPMRIDSPLRRRTADDDSWDDEVRHHSAWMTVVEQEGAAILVGCLSGPTPRLRIDQAAIEAFTENGQPAQWLILAGPATQVQADYAQALARALGQRPIRPQRVWCSWYSYYETISQEALEAEIPEAARLGVDTLQIDDGWQRAVGDWLPGERFPQGMAATAASITEAGMRPGLWIAPFITLPDSQAAREHPEMLVRALDGAPALAGSNWGTDYHALDMTHPRAQEHVRQTIARAVHEWGFTYLKLDFINAAAIPGLRHQQADREQVYRQALHLVREAAGEDAFLLGSGALIMPSIGILDAVRVGPDVAPMWENYASDDLSDAKAYNALHAGINRLWLGQVIGVDPDVVFFRHHRNLLDDTQMQWLQDLAAACRYRCLSDQAAWLTDQEKESIRQWMARDEPVEILGRYRFRLGEREIDLTRAIEEPASPYPL
ncbi:glycoside hydrolase family 36 protein [Actinomyces slackii]|uniref:Alpha-galactosidase n=1 Tax=Actinomyces slackii TaxID=52774 RepID=A0A448KAF7_9ACTO|nr:glycoside hydrolase family 36 protein [Actinomyces slackii]VEG73908.1 Alpha-galactosidase [Actinomyces slackii]